MLTIVQGYVPSKNKEKTEAKPKSSKIIEYQDDLYVKSTETKREFNVGFRIGKTDTGLEFQTLNQLNTMKNRDYKKVNLCENLDQILEEEEKVEKPQHEVILENLKKIEKKDENK